MNEKEVAEIRRRFKPEKSAVTHVRGCYVSAQGEVVSHFDQSLALMPQEEGENLMNLLRKTLSGGLGRNLLNLSFSTAQVVDSPEHKLLMALRDSQLQDQGAVEAFFQQVAASFRLEDMGYLILLAYDSYDVPYRGKDGGSLEDASETVYSYILCSLCPVKETKPVLSYRVPENLFRNREVDWVIAPPEAGFLFPAFDDRCAGHSPGKPPGGVQPGRGAVCPKPPGGHDGPAQGGQGPRAPGALQRRPGYGALHQRRGGGASGGLFPAL